MQMPPATEVDGEEDEAAESADSAESAEATESAEAAEAAEGAAKDELAEAVGSSINWGNLLAYNTEPPEAGGG
eukprot:21050-Prorocentrum_minimum.AAC.1